MWVTTHHIKLKVNGKTDRGYLDQDPISILVLKPGEKISLTATAMLGISIANSIFDAACDMKYVKNADDKYTIEYQTLGQLSSLIIFKKACTILKKKTEFLKKYITDNFQERGIDEDINIELFGEDSTMGCLLATVLQKCKYTENAGFYMQHIQLNSVNIQYRLKSTSKIGPIKVLQKCINYLQLLFEDIEQAANKINV